MIDCVGGMGGMAGAGVVFGWRVIGNYCLCYWQVGSSLSSSASTSSTQKVFLSRSWDVQADFLISGRAKFQPVLVDGLTNNNVVGTMWGRHIIMDQMSDVSSFQLSNIAKASDDEFGKWDFSQFWQQSVEQC